MNGGELVIVNDESTQVHMDEPSLSNGSEEEEKQQLVTDRTVNNDEDDDDTSVEEEVCDCPYHTENYCDYASDNDESEDDIQTTTSSRNKKSVMVKPLLPFKLVMDSDYMVNLMNDIFKVSCVMGTTMFLDILAGSKTIGNIFNLYVCMITGLMVYYFLIDNHLVKVESASLLSPSSSSS